jgi:hypothetical protein
MTVKLKEPPMASPTEDPGQFADDVIFDAIAAFNRRETKTSDSAALLSIAASLRQLCLQNAAALDGQDQTIAMSAKALELTERIATSAVPITAELVAGGCCSAQHAVEADNMLEDAFGIIANADNAIRSGGRLKNEWERAAARFMNHYNAKVVRGYGGSAEQQLIQLRAELEESIARDEIARLKAADDQHADLDAFAAEVDERSAD